MKSIDLSGAEFGKLVAISRATNQGSKTRWLCRCVCGTELLVTLGNLRDGHTKSCGCLKFETSSAAGKKALRHGEGHDNKTPEYRAWTGMRERCLVPTTSNYSEYGGRGIYICDRWDSYKVFLEDMGRRPSPDHSIDRKNNNGPYSPDNCRWATRKEQQRNRRANIRIEFKGALKTIAEWSEQLGLPYETLRQRIKHGWTPAEALNTPVQKRHSFLRTQALG